MNTKTTAKFACTCVLTACLAACGGGGSGIVNSNTSSSDSSSPVTAWTNSSQSTLTTDSTGSAVSNTLVGVVDSGFLTSFYEIAGQISAAQDFGGSGSIEDDVIEHGTEVAEIIAGTNVGYSGNTQLLLAKAADSSGDIYVSAVSNGAQWAMNNGAKVVNFSLSSMWETSTASEQAIYNTAISKDAVVVMAAGNDTASVSTLVNGVSTIFSTGNETMAALSLVVGALNGSALASYSNYAGDSTSVQDRFLVAQGTNYVQDRSSTAAAADTSGLTTFSGTSSATPVVTAAAAQLRAYWPSLTAAQTAQLLLDTADQSFNSLYSSNTCGSSGTTNCGLYYFGQGLLDLGEAMQPQGTTSIATGTQVNGSGSYTVASTSLTLPAAFGDALANRTVTSALFDSYGRNYNFNLLSRVSMGGTAGMGKLLDRSMIDHEVTSTATDVQSRFSFDRSGSLAYAKMDFNLDDKVSWGFTRAKGAATLTQETGVPMLGLAGTGALGQYGFVQGIHASMAMGRETRLNAGMTTATTQVSGLSGNVTATRHETGMNFKAGKATTVTAGLAYTRETNGLLGANGSGALALDGSSATAATFHVNSRLPHGWNAFGYAEFGAMRVRGTGALASFSGVRTSQYGAGLEWSDPLGEHLFGVALSQPIRVDNADVKFHVATGRTLDGQVIYSNSTASLSPSGRQFNLDLAYQRRLGSNSSLRLNALWIKDKNHISGNGDAGLVMSYRSAW